MLKKMRTVAGFVPMIFFVYCSTTGYAQTPNQIGKFNDWGSYAYKTKNGKTCYILTVPKVKEPQSVDHGDNFFLISQKPEQKNEHEPQFMAGYELKSNSKVVLTVSDSEFIFFTSGKSAWIEDASQEKKLLTAMKTGQTMSVKAISKRGTETSYSYSLSGISKALESIKSCQ
jgi:hypothetical protein